MTEMPRKLLTLDAPPPHIKARYARLALVMNREQLEAADPDRVGDLLVVACDWLLWQEEAAKRRHVVYYEHCLLDHEVPPRLRTDLHIHANDWHHDENGGAPTHIDGISFGRAFTTEIMLALMNYYRLRFALDALIDKFQPQEIVFFDFSYDVNLLTPAQRKSIVEMIVEERKLRFVDRSGDLPTGEAGVSEALYVGAKRRAWIDRMMTLYAKGLEVVTRLRTCLSPAERRVLMLVNTNLTGPLIRNFEGGLTPIFMGRTVPKKASFLWRCIRNGVLLISPPDPAETSRDRELARMVRDAFMQVIDAPSSGPVAFCREYVRTQIVETGRIEEMVREYRRVAALLDKYRPARVVIDSVLNPRYRMFTELAVQRGIAVDYTWHSLQVPLRHKFDPLAGDPRYTPTVTRNLTWGKVNETWLDRIGSRQPRVRVGSPVGQWYAGADAVAAPAEPAKANVMILQYTFITTDLAGLNTNMYNHFVQCVRELRGRGYRNIRYKLHPGPGRWKKEYFERISEFFGLDCEVLKTEPFHKCMRWADIVLGPCQSGAFYEGLASGKPYHAFLIEPHTVDRDYYDGFPLLGSPSELPRALHRANGAGGDKLLEETYSSNEIPNPSKRMWDALRSDFELPVAVGGGRQARTTS